MIPKEFMWGAAMAANQCEGAIGSGHPSGCRTWPLGYALSSGKIFRPKTGFLPKP